MSKQLPILHSKLSGTDQCPVDGVNVVCKCFACPRDCSAERRQLLNVHDGTNVCKQKVCVCWWTLLTAINNPSTVNASNSAHHSMMSWLIKCTIFQAIQYLWLENQLKPRPPPLLFSSVDYCCVTLSQPWSWQIAGQTSFTACKPQSYTGVSACV